ncbi:MAG: hypothetical protein Unbinned2514contig1000_28 [Prokaryotic dsDNA virus sp.]|nr:MAG: hypothetical protein Unbinned2514contig1000_28 [Prokaryotic dsDNA virus sp.]
MASRRELRDRFRNHFGFPEANTTGNNRFNGALNSALRHLWSDLPDALLSQEYRFVTEPPFEGGTLRVFKTSAVTDPLVMVRNETTGTLPSSEELRGRWIEISDGTNYHMRRIQEHFTANHTPAGGVEIVSADHFVLDHQWKNTTDTALSFRILTLDYPYQEDIQKIIHLIYDPDNGSTSTVLPMLRGDHDRIRRSGGWRATGNPQCWARGDFFQLPGPRYTPTAELSAGASEGQSLGTTLRWGWSSGGAEHGSGNANQPKYGPAGTFSYKVVHVWGRRPDYDVTNEGGKNPWYISSSSEATAQVVTRWGSSHVTIKTPDIALASGYNPNTTMPSYQKYGVEKWIFRARHATDTRPPMTGNGPISTDYPSDAVYYLWKIIDGHETETIDRGQEDPPDRRITLESWHGHQSIRFDRLPSSTVPVLMHVVKRPPQLHHDHDAPRIPEECIDCLYALVASYLAGDRDGSLERKQLYMAEYAEHRARLIRMVGIETAMVPAFGDGLSPTTSGLWPSYGQTVKEG